MGWGGGNIFFFDCFDFKKLFLCFGVRQNNLTQSVKKIVFDFCMWKNQRQKLPERGKYVSLYFI